MHSLVLYTTSKPLHAKNQPKYIIDPPPLPPAPKSNREKTHIPKIEILLTTAKWVGEIVILPW